MFGLILTAGVTLLQAYVFWRLASLPVFGRRGPRAALAVVGFFLWGVVLAGPYFGHRSDGFVDRAIEAVGMDWMVVLFLTTVCLLTVDLITGFGLLFRRVVPRLRAAAVMTGALLSVVAFIQGHRPPELEAYAVALARLPPEFEGRTIVALADLHLNATADESWLSARVQQVMAERPDLIVLLGDVVENRRDADAKFAPILRGLTAPLGVWAVLGNHESHDPQGQSAALLSDAGIRVLSNSWTAPLPGLVLAGVRDHSFAGNDGQVESDLAQSLEGAPPAATILLSHAPVGAEFAAAHGVGLLLCGHTHGGQVWPFNYLVGLRYPLLDGRYTVGGMTVIVSRGAGTWGPRMRLWSRGSIVRVTLRRG